MSTANRAEDDVFARARASLRGASREEKLDLVRRSGALAADALTRDRSWDEGTGRYRDRRGQSNA